MPAIRPPENSLLGEIKPTHPEASAFFAWLQDGIREGSIKYNLANAFVHFVPEGILLVSPRAIREHLESRSPHSVDEKAVKALQRKLQKSGLLKLSTPKSYLHVYSVLNATNPNRANLTGYLYPTPEQLFTPVPEINSTLSSNAQVAEGV